jgi:hypothetical protein
MWFILRAAPMSTIEAGSTREERFWSIPSIVVGEGIWP